MEKLNFSVFLLIAVLFVSIGSLSALDFSKKQIVPFTPILGDGICGIIESNYFDSPDCGTFKIRGQVTEYFMDIPVPNARVTIMDQDGFGYYGYTYTDSNGYFSYPLTIPMGYSFTVSKQGYITDTTSLFLVSQDDIELKMYKKPEEFIRLR